jgi:hypothetical protein
MTTLIQQIEEMRVRMHELADSEQGLVKTLGEALSRADQKLLREVRSLTAEHEERRGVILKELQSLAARMGAFPHPRTPLGQLENAKRDLPYMAPQAAGFRCGDWRKATANIEDELEAHLNGLTAAN